MRKIVFSLLLVASIDPLFAQNKIMDLMERTDLSLIEVERRAKIYFDSVGTGKGSMYKQYQRWLFERKFHLDENGFFISPQTEWNRFIEGKSALRTESMDAGNWVPLGPYTWSRTTSWSPGNGRLTAFAVHPANENIIYVGSPGGGLWKTINAGTNWTPLTDNNSLWMSVYSIAIDPSNQNTIYVGMENGIIIKSTNAGTSFTTMGGGTTGAVRKILVHPTNSNIVFACASNGIYRSVNGGTGWTQVHNIRKEDIEFKSDDVNIMFASGSSATSHFARSIDNGLTWTTLGSAQGITNSGRSLVGVTAASPNTVYLVQASGDLFGRMYKSTDGGLNFVTTVVGSPAGATNYFGYEPSGTGTGGQAAYDMAIEVSPTNANDVYIGGINVWKSTNGGSSFVPQTEWTYPNSTGYTHADMHGLFAVNANIYSISDGGLYRSSDNGNNWTDLSAGLVIRQLYRMANSQTNANVITAGSQDNGSCTRNASGNWTDWLGADGMEGLVSPTNHLNIWGSSQYGNIYRSTNGGTSYSNLTRPVDGNWVTPLCIHPTNGTILYGGWQGVWKSINSGTSWTDISPSINSFITDLALAPSAPTTIYASVGTTLHVTTNDGANWTTYSLSYSISDIAVDPTNPLKLWIATTSSANPVLVSVNGGASFTNVSGLPALAARTIVVDDNSPRGIYVGMNIGVYHKYETDPGWTDFSTNLPMVALNELEIQKASGLLRVATYGRAVWETPVAAPPVCLVPTVQATNIIFSSVQSTQMTVNWTNGNGAGRILVAKAGSAVTGSPANGTTYTGTTSFGTGQSIAANEFVIYSGAGSGPVTLTNLNPLTTYHFKVFEFNCTGSGILYNTSVATNNPASQATAACPAPTQASNIVFSNVQTYQLTVNWSNGNGTGRMLIAKAGSAVTGSPVNGTNYTGTPAFGTGQTIAANEFVIYSGTGSGPITMTGLNPLTTYHFKVFEYSCSGATLIYQTGTATNNPVSQTTAPCPAPTQANNIVFSNVQTNQVTVNWTNGNGTGRILVAKAGSAVAGSPANSTSYTGTAAFGTGQTIAANEFVIYSGTGAGPITMTGLDPLTTYHFKVFEYSCSGATLIYQTGTATNNPASQTTAPCPAPTQANNIVFSNVQTNQVTVNWTNGNGTGRILVAKAGSAVAGSPANSTSYTGTAAFGTGQTIAANEFVIYSGSGSGPITMTGLDPLTTYHLKVFEYSCSGATLVYQTGTATNNPASQTTAACPAPNQANNIVFSNVQTNQMTVNWTNGTGAGRIAIYKAGSAVTAVPVNGVSYTVGQEIAPSEFVFFASTGTSPSVMTGLSPGVNYYVRVFEYNCTGPALVYNSSIATNNPNNQSTVAATPDLAIYGESVTPLAPNAGAFVTVNAGENNSGTGTAVANHIGVWLSVDAGFNTGSDIYLGQLTVASLAAGANSGILSANLQLPATLCNGNYYIFFHADDNQVVTESNESNNLASVVISVTAINPSVQANILSSPYNGATNSITLNMQPGNGSRRVVHFNTVNSFTPPANGSDPAANTVYGGGEQVVYNGTGNTVTITGLNNNTTYCMRIYEANCSGVSSMYNISTTASNPVCQSGAPLPPDLTSSQFLSTTQIAAGATINECIVIRNVGSGATTGPIVFSITNYSALSGLTVSMNMAPSVTIGIDNYILDNSNWLFDPGTGTITSNPGVVIPPGGSRNIGVRIVRGLGALAGANGTVTQTTSISAGTGGGDNLILNNSISNSILKN